MPSNASELRAIAAGYAMDCVVRADGLRQIKMHIGDAEFPVLIGHDKLPELVAELKTLDMDKAFAIPAAINSHAERLPLHRVTYPPSDGCCSSLTAMPPATLSLLFPKHARLRGTARLAVCGPFAQVFLGYDENTFKYCAPRLEAELERQGIPFYSCVMGLTEDAKNMASLDRILETFLQGGGSRCTNSHEERPFLVAAIQSC
eukprot:3976455-Pleurochrysis_carterae.AAC.4